MLLRQQKSLGCFLEIPTKGWNHRSNIVRDTTKQTDMMLLPEASAWPGRVTGFGRDWRCRTDCIGIGDCRPGMDTLSDVLCFYNTMILACKRIRNDREAETQLGFAGLSV